MKGIPPPEVFPHIGTVPDPSLFFDEGDLLLSYQIAPVSGEGCAILRFAGVIHFECNPMNTHGVAMGQSLYPTTMWGFTEVTGSDRTEGWNARFWTISFNDRTVEVVFDKVGLLDLNSKTTEPRKALLDYLSRHRSG